MEFPEADEFPDRRYKDFIYDERSWWNTYDVEAHFSKFEIMKILIWNFNWFFKPTLFHFAHKPNDPCSFDLNI